MATAVATAALGQVTFSSTAVGALTTIVAVSAATYVDQAFVLPLFADTPDKQPLDLQGLRIQTSDEGAPINFAAGRKARVSGTLIWYSGPSVVSVGGNGSKRGAGVPPQDEVRGSYQILLGEGFTLDGTQPILKAWANGRPFYVPGTSANYVANSTNGFFVGHLTRVESGVTNILAVDVVCKFQPPSEVGDLRELRKGGRVTLTGFGAPYDRDWIVAADQFNDRFNSLYVMSPTLGTEYVGVRLVPVSAVDATSYPKPTNPTEIKGSATITQTAEEFNADELDGIRIYTGSELFVPGGTNTTQVADPLIEQFEGAINVPAYLGRPLVVVENHRLTEFGNRPPQMEFLLNVDTDATPATALAALLSRGALAEGAFGFGADFDVSRVDSADQDGVAVRGPQPLKDQVRGLLTQRDILHRDIAGQLVFFQREDADVVQISVDDMTARPAGQRATDRPFIVDDVPERDIPTEYNISFTDSENDYQAGSAIDVREDTAYQTSANESVPVAMTSSEARAIARRRMHTAEVNRQVFRFTLPPKYMGVDESVVLEWAYEGETFRAIVEQVDRAPNGLLSIRARAENSITLTNAGVPAQPPAYTAPVLPNPQPATYEVLDIPPLINSLANTPHLVVVGCTTDRNAAWRGAQVYISTDDSTFREFQTIQYETPVGIAITALPSGPVGGWDPVSTVTVQLDHGTLATVTEAEVLAGLNRMVIGDEIIGFRDVTLVTTGIYTLSYLLRGLGDTWDETAGHVAGERAVSIDLLKLIQTEPTPITDPTAIGSTRYFKCAAPGQDLADIPSREAVITGRSVTPFAPYVYSVAGDGSGGITLTWQRRSRGAVNPFEVGGDDYETAPRVFRIRVLNSGDTELRSETVSGVSTFTYTAAMLSADSQTLGSTIKFRVSQIGAFAESKAFPIQWN